MQNNILYIHGFASVGVGQKSTQLQTLFNTPVFAPNLNHRPLEDVALLKKMVKEQHITTVIGSSLGVFYGLLVALAQPVQLILINPAVRSPETLQKYIGTVERYNGEQFLWSQQQVDELAILAKEISPQNLAKQLDQKRILTLLAKHDEVLDYRDAATLLSDSHIIIDEAQDHRFADLSLYNDIIAHWHQAK